jgi:hypothetical protein
VLYCALLGPGAVGWPVPNILRGVVGCIEANEEQIAVHDTPRTQRGHRRALPWRGVCLRLLVRGALRHPSG